MITLVSIIFIVVIVVIIAAHDGGATQNTIVNMNEIPRDR